MYTHKMRYTALIVLVAAILTSCSSTVSTNGFVDSPIVGIQRFLITSPSMCLSTVDRTGHTVILYVPDGTDLATLSPVITLSSGYTIEPASGAPTDFSPGAVTYKLTDAAGAATDYSVQVTTDIPSAATVNGWLGKGINLGNDLDAWPGAEGSWTDGVVADDTFFDDYKAAGFDSVRIPITWSSRLGADSPYTVNSTFMSRVATIAGWGIDRGLAVVINAHHEDWIRKMDHATYIGTDGQKQKARFVALWTQIADQFKDAPPQLVFEILNEPQGAMTNTDVSDLHAAVLAVIRASGGSNATRTVILGANSWSSMNALQNTTDKFLLPDDDYIIATFHSYDPWAFAGQANGSWGSASDISQMKGGLATVAAWAAGKGVPLYMGEYGATLYKKDAGGKVTGSIDGPSRKLWYTEMAKAARANGISYAAWDDFGDFKLYDRTGGTFEQAIINVILNPAE